MTDLRLPVAAITQSPADHGLTAGLQSSFIGFGLFHFGFPAIIGVTLPTSFHICFNLHICIFLSLKFEIDCGKDCHS